MSIHLYSETDKKRFYDKENKKFYENIEENRDEFYKDYCRIIHSPSFRRLQCKCQLFPVGESDFFRNRLTHSLEVAQIGRGIAFKLNKKSEFQEKNAIDPVLVEIAGLAHDLGHPPFGHQGEKALDDCMAKYGGFEGNAQTLRILTKIEKKVKDENSDEFGITTIGEDLRYGLNLTYRALASILKYDKMIKNRFKIQYTKDIFFDEYKKIIKRGLSSKKNNGEIDNKYIEKKKCKLSEIINFDEFKEFLIKNLIINKEGYPTDIDTFFDNIEILKLDKKLNEYEDDIKKSLISWFNLVKFQKGYYKTEKDIVNNIKKNVVKDENYDNFKTIECQIMDIADDIAYSTYDLEDALKGKFISIFDCLIPESEITKYVTKKLNKCSELNKDNYIDEDVRKIFLRIFDATLNVSRFEKIYTIDKGDKDLGKSVIYFIRLGGKFNTNGYVRINLTSSLIGRFINGVEIKEVNKKRPALTKIELKQEIREEVEVLKNFTYIRLISSNLLKIPAHRGYDIVKTIFDELQKPDGHLLLPDDYKHIYLKVKSEIERKRIICDFIAGMTDRYVLEFYGRLKSENPQSIFKPI